MLKEQLSNELKLYGILSSAFAILKKYAKEILIINLMCIAPMLIILQLAYYYKLNTDIFLFGFNIVNSIIAIIPSISVILIADLDSRQEYYDKPTINDILKAVMPRFASTIGVYALTMISVIFSLFLLIIPGIITMVYLAFTSQIVVLRGYTGLDALKESFQLVNDNWLKVFAYLLVFIIPRLFFLFVSYVLGFNSEATFSFDSFIGDLILSLNKAFLNVFAIISMTLTFLNLEAVKAKSY